MVLLVRIIPYIEWRVLRLSRWHVFPPVGPRLEPVIRRMKKSVDYILKQTVEQVSDTVRRICMPIAIVAKWLWTQPGVIRYVQVNASNETDFR